jgi:hypothetical protein
MLGEVGLAFGFVPVPHLYAYIKGKCKGEGRGGMVKEG